MLLVWPTAALVPPSLFLFFFLFFWSPWIPAGLKIIRRNVSMFNSIPDDGGGKTKKQRDNFRPPFTASHYVILFFISILDNLLHTYTRRHTRLFLWSGCEFSVVTGQLPIIFPVSGKHFQLCLLNAHTAARGGKRNFKRNKQINKKQTGKCNHPLLQKQKLPCKTQQSVQVTWVVV